MSIEASDNIPDFSITDGELCIKKNKWEACVRGWPKSQARFRRESVTVAVSGRAFYAALRAALNNGNISYLFCPGRVPYPDAATEMAAAYSDWKKRA